MSVDFKQIYQTQAEEYEYLVAHEDYEGNIFKALWAIRPFTQTTVVESGAGTGRLTRLLAPHVAQITAGDIAQPMLEVARRHLSAGGWQNWHTLICDHRAIPVKAKSADIFLVGWSLSHFIRWHAGSWQQEVGKVLAEMRRLLRPGGTAIILETLGTNEERPRPPHSGLADYYRWLEEEQGFSSTWIRTDYGYPSVATAVASTRFFFGDEMADDVQRKNSPIVPECTGIWWRELG